jgi:hypothetical protein
MANGVNYDEFKFGGLHVMYMAADWNLDPES